jgi:hypothetical protein
MIRSDFVYNLDPAVIRGDRFDDQHSTCPTPCRGWGGCLTS